MLWFPFSLVSYLLQMARFILFYYWPPKAHTFHLSHLISCNLSSKLLSVQFSLHPYFLSLSLGGNISVETLCARPHFNFVIFWTSKESVRNVHWRQPFTSRTTNPALCILKVIRLPDANCFSYFHITMIISIWYALFLSKKRNYKFLSSIMIENIPML